MLKNFRDHRSRSKISSIIIPRGTTNFYLYIMYNRLIQIRHRIRVNASDSGEPPFNKEAYVSALTSTTFQIKKNNIYKNLKVKTRIIFFFCILP